jgi:hypothetical protein
MGTIHYAVSLTNMPGFTQAGWMEMLSCTLKKYEKISSSPFVKEISPSYITMSNRTSQEYTGLVAPTKRFAQGRAI